MSEMSESRLTEARADAEREVLAMLQQEVEEP